MVKRRTGLSRRYPARSGLLVVSDITPGSRADLEPLSGGKSVAVQPIVKALVVLRAIPRHLATRHWTVKQNIPMRV